MASAIGDMTSHENQELQWFVEPCIVIVVAGLSSLNPYKKFSNNFLHIFYFRVSSVLNRDVTQYGKKFLFDKREDTCWNSDQVRVT